jgi:ribosomal protein L37AE/L43A
MYHGWGVIKSLELRFGAMRGEIAKSWITVYKQVLAESHACKKCTEHDACDMHFRVLDDIADLLY